MIEGYKVVALLLKPSLCLFGLVSRCRVLLPHPGSATGHLIAPVDHYTLQHIQVHFGVDFQADFEDLRWHVVAFNWNHTKDHNRCRKLCFHHSGHVPVIHGNPDLHFEGVGNSPVVITWIGREHELYSGASPISLVKHCVPFRHDRRLLSLLGFVHNWPTSRWSATKKENRFSLHGNGIMSSFLGRQFNRSTLKRLHGFLFKVIPTESNELFNPSLSHFYALLEGFCRDALRLRRYHHLRTFEMGPLDNLVVFKENMIKNPMEQAQGTKEVFLVRWCSSQQERVGCSAHTATLLFRHSRIFGDNFPFSVHFVSSWLAIIRTVNRRLPHTNCLTCSTLTSIQLVQSLLLLKLHTLAPFLTTYATQKHVWMTWCCLHSLSEEFQGIVTNDFQTRRKLQISVVPLCS